MPLFQSDFVMSQGIKGFLCPRQWGRGGLLRLMPRVDLFIPH